MRVGVCGGTFDPFHRGHLDTVLAVRDAMEWDRVVYMPAWRQPFKSDRDAASGYHRFAMIALATEECDAMMVSPVELERGGISYTVDTLETLRAQYAGDTLDWIIGDDNLAALGAWRNLPRIFELANFAVLTRNAPPEVTANASMHGAPVVEAASRPAHGTITFAHNPTVPVSSTEIRNRIRAGEPIDALVDPRVARYIDHNRLYREAHA